MRKKKHDPDAYTSLAIKVSKWEVAVGESINVNLRTTVPYSWDESDPVFTENSQIAIGGVCTYPEHRANDAYEITIYSDGLARQRLTLDQIHVRDQHSARVYRKCRGSEYPVFKVPPGLTIVERLRGTRQWQTVLWFAPDTFGRILTILNYQQQLYVSIDEHKIDRQRWVRGFAVQTSDPAKE